ncbi:MAG TPA: hypothetical protein VGS96_15790 [Thermoanaerobaculia bacterium]|nr:hypothetical protein [Thermoanaerobaculia bacterium]
MCRMLLLFLAAASVASAADLVPLDELGNGTYLSYGGGLYENGSNTMPPDHLAAGLFHAQQVVPRDRDGRPSAAGKIVMISIGMSNTTQEFCVANNPAPCTSWSFVGQATADPAVNHETLVLVNGAAGGKSADFWDSPSDPDYNRVRDNDLTPLGLTEAQVQVAWVKVANPQPAASLPSANADAFRLETQMGNIARALKVRYPNIQLAYFSSRAYAGYASSTLNPEPYAYESALAVKWVVDAQVQQRRSGTVVDARAGDLSDNSIAPWIAWGPYLWRDRTFWSRTDFEGDGTHPSQSGEQKVGAMLLSFFKAEPTAQTWFIHALPTKRRAARH